VVPILNHMNPVVSLILNISRKIYQLNQVYKTVRDHIYAVPANTRFLAVSSPILRGSANKSLVRPTAPCRWTESIVSLERGVCSCAELQVFSSYRG